MVNITPCQEKSKSQLNQKPIMYLDLDDTILLEGRPLVNSASFFQWCVKHFEVRWLTRWCPGGILSDSQTGYLSDKLKVSKETIMICSNPKSFHYVKTDAIDWETTRPWAWVENNLNEQFPQDYQYMMKLGGKLHYYETSLHKNPNQPDNAISQTWKRLAIDFNIQFS